MKNIRPGNNKLRIAPTTPVKPNDGFWPDAKTFQMWFKSPEARNEKVH